MMNQGLFFFVICEKPFCYCIVEMQECFVINCGKGCYCHDFSWLITEVYDKSQKLNRFTTKTWQTLLKIIVNVNFRIILLIWFLPKTFFKFNYFTELIQLQTIYKNELWSPAMFYEFLLLGNFFYKRMFVYGYEFLTRIRYNNSDPGGSAI